MKLHGTITALITPFRGGTVDFDALTRLVESQIAAGVDGLVPCGTTGESPTLSKDEHKRVVECVTRAARKRVPVIAGAGSNNTAEAVRLAREAAELGADALLVVAPYYNRPNQEGLYQHFAAVASATPLPIVLYNIPGRCGVEVSVETLRRLREAHPTIVSVKHATGSVGGAAELLGAVKIEVLSGDDPITQPLMALGAVGVVSVISNLAPRAVKRLTQSALEGDAAGALAAHRALWPLMHGLLALDVNPIPIKTAMAMRGHCAEEFRLPLVSLAPEKRGRLETLLRDHALD
ncbi:MAG: 4-hydroxy-tetrahydrodipicolinate synthase [Phycisphaerae bacterium]